MYYESTRVMWINDYAYTAFVSVVGREADGKKELQAIQLGIGCSNDLANPVVHYILDASNGVSPNASPIWPELTINVNNPSLGFNPLGFPGAGAQLAPRLMVAFGIDRDRYDTAADLQKYAGVAPVLERSGQKTWIHWRYSCPKFIRQTFVEWAGQSIKQSFWAKAYYQQQIDKGKSHHVATRALAFKWIRIAFRCWKNRTPYDESRYLEALKSRGAPLLSYAIKQPD